MNYRVGIDIGGTFTDIVFIDENGAIETVKVPSTPENQSIAVMNGLKKASIELDRKVLRDTPVRRTRTVATPIRSL